MRLALFHYHWRPGGVRRVVETLVRSLGNEVAVTLISGEPAPDEWLAGLQIRRPSLRALWFPPLGYAESVACDAVAVTHAALSVAKSLEGPHTVCLHNLTVGRNALLWGTLSRTLRESGHTVVQHAHDWWFDGRWHRFPEIHALTGLDERGAVAAAVGEPEAAVFAINLRDTQWLNGLGRTAFWMPNPVEKPPVLNALERSEIRDRLASRTGHPGPYAIYPARLVRRKNIAEAALLLRALWPEALLLVSGGAHSADELRYAAELRQLIAEARLPVVLEAQAGSPDSVAATMLAADLVVVTSAQEGFGLPYFEAAAAGLPLLASRPPMLEADFRALDFHSPGLIPLLQVRDGAGSAIPFHRLHWEEQCRWFQRSGGRLRDALAIDNPWLHEIPPVDDVRRLASTWSASMEAWLNPERSSQRFLECCQKASCISPGGNRVLEIGVPEWADRGA